MRTPVSSVLIIATLPHSTIAMLAMVSELVIQPLCLNSVDCNYHLQTCLHYMGTNLALLCIL